MSANWRVFPIQSVWCTAWFRARFRCTVRHGQSATRDGGSHGRLVVRAVRRCPRVGGGALGAAGAAALPRPVSDGRLDRRCALARRLPPGCVPGECASPRLHPGRAACGAIAAAPPSAAARVPVTLRVRLRRGRGRPRALRRRVGRDMAGPRHRGRAPVLALRQSSPLRPDGPGVPSGRALCGAACAARVSPAVGQCDCVQHCAFRSEAPRAASAGCRPRRRHLSAGSPRARGPHRGPTASGCRCASCGLRHRRASCLRRV